MNFFRFPSLLSLVCLIYLSAACGGQKTTEPAQKGRKLVIEDTVFLMRSLGDTLAALPVALADEETERNSGLMDVFDLKPASGMLFIFEKEEPLTFWMANTPLSLDMVFINKNHEIVAIHSETQPYSNTTYASERPANRVLELPGGWCAARDIKEGMLIFQKSNP